MVTAARRGILNSGWRNKLRRVPPDATLYYPGLEGGGSTLLDYSGNAKNGTIVGATWGRTRTGLWYLSLDGDDDYVTISNPAVTTDEAGTISLWVKIDVLGAGPGLFCYVKPSTASVDAMRFFVNSNRAITYDIYKDSVYTMELNSPLSVFTLSLWHKVTWTSDGSTIVLYLDGVSQVLTEATGTNTGEWFADAQTEPADTLVLGGYYRLDALVTDFAGDIALFEVESTTRSAAREKELYAQEKGIFGG